MIDKVQAYILAKGLIEEEAQLTGEDLMMVDHTQESGWAWAFFYTSSDAPDKERIVIVDRLNGSLHRFSSNKSGEPALAAYEQRRREQMAKSLP